MGGGGGGEEGLLSVNVFMCVSVNRNIECVSITVLSAGE